MLYIRKARALSAAGILFAALALFSVACSDDDDSGADDPQSPTPDASAADTGEETPEVSETPGIEFPPECVDADATVGLVARTSFGAPSPFAAGQPVDATLRVVNCGDNDAELYYSTTQRAFMTVSTEDGTEIWRSDDGETFEPTPGELIIATGQVESYTETWDQLDRNGAQVPPGNYKVTYFSLGCGQPGATTDCRFADVAFFQIQ